MALPPQLIQAEVMLFQSRKINFDHVGEFWHAEGTADALRPWLPGRVGLSKLRKEKGMSR
jgi:hypothetical protein